MTNVLLSTHNGERFLSEQLASLIQQDFSDIIITIRDDGSSDRTLEIINKFSAKHPIIRYMQGENIGVVKSYFALLLQTDSNCEYFAYCDQDDVWKNDKISRAIKLLKQLDSRVPAMYCSRVEFVNENLQHIGFSEIPAKIGFANAIVENAAVGCTIVINLAARNLLIQSIPSFALMHDWWSYLVISAFGKVIYDPESRILYRQHSSNVMGGSENRLLVQGKRIIPFIKSLFESRKRTSDQAQEFRCLFGDRLPAEGLSFVDNFIGAKQHILKRLSLINDSRYKRNNSIDGFLYCLQILFGFY
jgi:glycosyltransferase involved in cell wall biosynthesis